MRNIRDIFWHRLLKRPYVLARTVNQGTGTPVILLHGIGRSAVVWQNVIDQLQAVPCRAVAFDLLGFGASPKPTWPKYDIDDHAKAVIASLDKLKSGQPAILVGHSMGCLVAVRVARLRPDLVMHLVLYEMPLYEGLPEKRRYRLRLNAYFTFYKRMIAYQPTFDAENQRWAQKLARRITGFEVDKSTWLPFVRSLENTIMSQTAPEDIKYLNMPMDAIYGLYDMFVIRGKLSKTLGIDTDNIKSHTVRAKHSISATASQFIVQRILAALETTE